MKRNFPRISSALLLIKISLACVVASAAATPSATPAVAQAQAGAKLVLYSSRTDHLIEPLLQKYKEKSGTEVKFISGEAPVLLERLKSEGARSTADLLITVDAGNLWQAAERGLFVPLQSAILKEKVPAHLSDPKGRWYGLSIRARTIYYNPKKVKASELSTYEDLSLPKWKNRLCLRTSNKVYNQSLVALLIARIGEKETEKVVKGWVDNLAAPVFSSDNKVLEAIAAGQCDVGIANTYYFGKLKKEKPQLAVESFWANQQTSGVHVNVSGGGVLKTSKNQAEAQKFLEWLVTDEAQAVLAESNLEFPVVEGIKPDPVVAKWGAFKQDQTNLFEAGARQAQAMKLMDRVGYK